MELTNGEQGRKCKLLRDQGNMYPPQWENFRLGLTYLQLKDPLGATCCIVCEVLHTVTGNLSLLANVVGSGIWLSYMDM